MKFSKKIIKMIIISLSCISSMSIISGAIAGIFVKQNKKDFVDSNQKYSFNNIIFNSKKEALEYASSLIKLSNIDATNKKVWNLDLNNASYVFDAPDKLNEFLNRQIVTIQTTTDIYNHKLNLSDNSIVSSEIVNYNIDNKTNSVINPNYINVYEANNDTYTYTLNSNNNFDDTEAINDAKDSYLNIHRVYYFNGIYFKSKQDLEIYLRNHYVNEAVGEKEDTTNYRKLISCINPSIRSNPIDFSSYINNNEFYNDENLMKQVNLDVAKFLSKNSYQYIKLGNGNDVNYIKVTDNSLDYEDVQDISLSSLPIISLKSNQNKSLYIVDASYEEEYNLFGPYFLQTDSLIENITNKSLWKISNDKPEQILKSQVIEMFSGFLDLFMLDPSTDWTQKNFGLSYSYIDGYYLEKQNSLFNITNYDNSNLNELEKNMYLGLMEVKTENNTNLYDQFINMVNRLVKTKSFTSFYAIPIMYAYLIESLVDAYAPYDAYLAVKKYFIEVCNIYDSLLLNLFGKDILTKYSWLYTENENKQNEIFSFADFFGINQVGFDYNSLGTILSGNNFLREYKQLFAASYVYVQAIANSQRNIKINYDVRKDETILKVLAEGSNNDQNNATNIKNKFSLVVNETSIYDKLQAIYDSIGNISNIIDKEIETNVFNDKQQFSYDLIKKSELKLNDYENSNPSQLVVDECNKLIQILNPISTYNNSNYNEVTKLISYESLKQKVVTKYKTSIKLSYDLEESLKTNYFVGEFEILNKQPSNNSGYLINKFKKEFNFDLEVEQEYETSYEYFNEIKTAHEISKEKELNNNFKFDNFMACLNGGMSILQSVSKIISDSENEFYPENIRVQLIACSVMDILSTTLDVASNFIPQPFGAIAKGVAGVFSLISGAIGQAKQEIYEFKINETNGDSIKYYWDGGLVMNRLFGLIRDEVRTIDSLKMTSPIRITKARNKDFYFFNSKYYNEGDVSILKKDVIKEMLLRNDENLKIVYSLDKDLNNEYVNVNNKIAFENIYDSDLNNKNTLSQFVIGLAIKNINEEISSKYIANIENEIFFNGYKFSSLKEFKDTMQDKIINKIKPIYVAQLPQLNKKLIPEKDQLSFQLPYPYFESSNDHDNQIIYEPIEDVLNTINKRDYIISNANEYINSQQLPETKIKNNVRDVFRQSFNINSKTVLRNSTLKYKKFSDFNVDAYNINVYCVDLNEKGKKYFINKIDAYNYLMGSLNLKNDSFLLESNKYEVLSINLNNQQFYFNNYTEFIRWFESKLIKIDKKGAI